jgi:hypothetical protein
VSAGEDSPSFYFLFAFIAAADFNFSVMLLCIIHGQVEFLAHRHNQ